MAQDRFYFWRGYYEAMEYLTDEEAGQLFRAICAYAFDGVEPEFEDRMMQVAWAMVAGSVSESVEIGRRSSEAGKRGGGRPRKTNTKKGAKKGVKNPPENPPENPLENVRYGKVPHSASQSVGDASRLAPDGAARAPIVLENGITIPPPPMGGGC